MEGMDMSSPRPQIMVFTTATTGTPLYSASWIPSTAGAYAGTCIFLILLAVIFRAQLAGKAFLERRWRDRAAHRRYVRVMADRQESDAARDEDEDGEDESKDGRQYGTLVSARGMEEQVRLVTNATNRALPAWRLSEDVPRALYVTVLAGVGYLLMLAVMTMNTGYFLSILGGVFLGELIVGRYAQLEEH